MKVMIDTNVIISAAFNPNSVSAASMYKALTYPFLNKGNGSFDLIPPGFIYFNPLI